MVFVCFCLLRCFRRSKPNQSFWALPLANFLMTTKGLWAVITLDETGIWPVSPRPWNCLIFDRKIWFLERPGDDWWTLCCDKPDSTSQVVSTTHIIDASFSLMARLFAVQYVWSQIRLARTAVRIAACIFQKVESLCLILFSAFRDDLCWWSVISVSFHGPPSRKKIKGRLQDQASPSQWWVVRCLRARTFLPSRDSRWSACSWATWATKSSTSWRVTLLMHEQFVGFRERRQRIKQQQLSQKET